MTYKLDFELSPELEVYRDKIEASIKPYLELKITENGNPTLWQTKFGGNPYLPKNCDYPKSWDGEYLYLLAQINFGELPHLEDFPEQGILQFYIGEEDMYGCDFDNPTRQDNLITDFSFLPENPDLPIRGCCAVEAIDHYAPMILADYGYYNFSTDEIAMLEEISIFLEEKEEEDSELFADSGHKLGGYPFFVQDDPRPLNLSQPNKENYTLLLQIDTDGNEIIDIMWGDCGIGNFFIKRSMLKKLDFSDVIYNWDCA